MGYGWKHPSLSDKADAPFPHSKALGEIMTVFALGLSRVSFDRVCAVAKFTPDVILRWFYAPGVAATFGPMDGFPGNFTLENRITIGWGGVGSNLVEETFQTPGHRPVSARIPEVSHITAWG